MMDHTLPPLGIDVSKLTLDARLLSQHRPGPPRRFANSSDGLTLLAPWLESQGISRVHACLEATGTYSDAIATFLFEHGHQVSVVNPARVTAFRLSEGIRTKTDRHDALLLARFCEQKRPALWRPTPVEIQRLQGLLGRLDDLQLSVQQERNRCENLRLDAQIRQEIGAHVSWLQQQRERTLQCAITQVQQYPHLQHACDRLDSIPGLACLTAMRLYSVYFDQHRFRGAPQVVAYAGLCPAQRLSGTSVHGKPSISMAGNAQVRQWLYMSALSVLRYDPRKAFPTHEHSTGVQAPMPTEQEHVASVRKEFMHHQTTQKTRLTTCLHLPAARPPHECRSASEDRISFLCPVSFCQQTSTNRHDFQQDLNHRQKPLTMKTVSTRTGILAPVTSESLHRSFGVVRLRRMSLMVEPHRYEHPLMQAGSKYSALHLLEHDISQVKL